MQMAYDSALNFVFSVASARASAAPTGEWKPGRDGLVAAGKWDAFPIDTAPMLIVV
jgi:hypothetical protein